MATEIWKSQFAFIRKSQLVSEKSRCGEMSRKV